MKAIQITVDEGLLTTLDADPEVQQLGRSAVVRRAVEAYLRQRRQQTVGEMYERAYKRKTPRAELKGWSAEGSWPES